MSKLLDSWVKDNITMGRYKSASGYLRGQNVCLYLLFVDEISFVHKIVVIRIIKRETEEQEHEQEEREKKIIVNSRKN